MLGANQNLEIFVLALLFLLFVVAPLGFVFARRTILRRQTSIREMTKAIRMTRDRQT